MTPISVPSGSRGREGSAQIVQLLHGALHRFTSATMDAISSPSPHIISLGGFHDSDLPQYPRSGRYRGLSGP